MSQTRSARRARRAAPFVLTTLATALSALAISIVAMSLPWVLISGGQGATAAGIAAFALHLPSVVGLFFAGRIVDRIGARRVVIASDTLALICMGGALVLSAVAGGFSWAVLAALGAANFAAAPSIVAQGARLPELARLARLPLVNANSAREIAGGLAYVLGPAAAVLLVERVGLTGVIAAVAGLLALILLIDLFAFPRFGPARRRQDEAHRPAWRFADDPTLKIVVVLGVLLVGVYASLDEILAPALVVAVDARAEDLALFLFLIALASFGATTLFAVIGHRLPRPAVFRGGIMLYALGLCLLASLPPELALLAAPVLIGLGGGPLGPIVTTAVQERVPAAVRGHAVGRVWAAIMAAQPFAALGAGPAIDLIGPFAMTWALAAAVTLCTVLALFHPAVDEIGQRPKAAGT